MNASGQRPGVTSRSAREALAARRNALHAELAERRDDFLAALADVDPELATAPGLVGDWSARDLVVHVGFWSDHAAGALALVAAGRAAEFAYDPAQTDAINERAVADGRALSQADAMRREAGAFRRFGRALARITDPLLDTRLGNGDRVEELIRYDGPDHFAEHAGQIRAWFTGADEPEDDG